MGLLTLGSAKIEMGAPHADGGMSQSLTRLGYTTEGSIKFNDEGGQDIDFSVEELDVPLHSITKQGSKSFTFQVADPDEDTLVRLFGGSVTGTNNSKVWTAPLTIQDIYASLKFTPRQGMGLSFPKCKVSAKWTSDIGRDKLLGVEVTFKILNPDKAGLSPMSTFRV